MPVVLPPGSPRDDAGRAQGGHRQGFGWRAMAVSISLHAAVVALLAWLTLGGQGNDGQLGNDLVDDTAAAADEQEFVMTLPPPRTAREHQPLVPAKPVREMPVTALKRLAVMSPTSALKLPDLPKPQATTPPLPMPVAAVAPLTPVTFNPLVLDKSDLRPQAESKKLASRTNGKGKTTGRKAAGKGSGGGAGDAKLLTQQPRAISSPAPAYPTAARAVQAQGTATIRVTVSETGRVTECSVHNSSGNETLDRAALAAVKRWRFAPGLRASVAVEADVLVRVVFRLAA